MPTLTAKKVADSQITLIQIMRNEHANPHGNVHGGVIIKLADEAGGLAAHRHAGNSVVTVYIDSMQFAEPVHIGEMLRVHAEVTWVGRTSIETLVTVQAEDVRTGHRIDTNSAFFVYVALDDRGRPAPVPPLIPETDEQRARMVAAEKRREYRLKMRATRTCPVSVAREAA